jgi:competence protein ComEC
MIRKPLVVLALFFSLGIFLGDKIKISLPVLFIALAIILVFVLFLFKKRCLFEILLFAFAFIFGMGLLKNSRVLPRCHISHFLSYKNESSYLVKGFINSEPALRNKKTSFVFRAQEIQAQDSNHTCCGNILVYLKTRREIFYGQELLLRGNLYRPFARKEYNQNIGVLMNVKSELDMEILNKNKGFSVRRFALWLKNKIKERLFRCTDSLTAAIINAMVLGERSNIPWFVNNMMIKCGTIHILVVSGFNVGVVTFIIILFLKLMRLPRNLRFCLAILCLVLYCVMTGASTPVIRATLMAITFLIGFLIKREPDMYNSCAAALIFILMINPRQLFDIGLELSFASVLSIIYFYPKLKKVLRLNLFKIKLLRFIVEGFLVSLSAWLGTVALVAYYFKIFSPVSVLANIFIAPLAALITLCGFSLVLVSLISPFFSRIFASATELAVSLLLNTNALLIKIPGAYFLLKKGG